MIKRRNNIPIEFRATRVERDQEQCLDEGHKDTAVDDECNEGSDHTTRTKDGEELSIKKAGAPGFKLLTACSRPSWRT